MLGKGFGSRIELRKIRHGLFVLPRLDAAGSLKQVVQQGSQKRTLASSQRQKKLVTALLVCAIPVIDIQK